MRNSRKISQTFFWGTEKFFQSLIGLKKYSNELDALFCWLLDAQFGKNTDIIKN